METDGKGKKNKDSALSVSAGVPRADPVNKQAFDLSRQKRKQVLTATEYAEGILNHDPVILSQAITIIESSREDHNQLAQEIVGLCLPESGNSIRVGITGVPGVGKSTFIEEFGGIITSSGKKLAVLAIDPSSVWSGGSIMGDKTRMETLASDPNAFIRPSPSAGSLGGVARKTRETIILCEAAGFDVLFIETVGVGQSEVAVHSMVDFFLLLMLPGSGDELQGIKRGIMEMADLIAITKADGDNLKKAERAMVDFRNALHFFPPAETGWTPKVSSCSAYAKNGLTEIWTTILEFVTLTRVNGWFEKNRNSQSKYWMYQTIEEKLKYQFYKNELIQKKLSLLEKKVLNMEISPFLAAQEILNEYYKNQKKE